jgi:hypothetical protein
MIALIDAENFHRGLVGNDAYAKQVYCWGFLLNDCGMYNMPHAIDVEGSEYCTNFST